MFGSSKTYGSNPGLCFKEHLCEKKICCKLCRMSHSLCFSCHIVSVLAPSVSITSPRGGRVEVIEGQDLRLECELAPGDRSSQIYWTLRYESTYIKNLRKLDSEWQFFSSQKINETLGLYSVHTCMYSQSVFFFLETYKRTRN